MVIDFFILVSFAGFINKNNIIHIFENANNVNKKTKNVYILPFLSDYRFD